MDKETTRAMAIEKEKTKERNVIIVGRLGDLGLGNPEGIPSRYAEASDEELRQTAEAQSRRLVAPTELTATACIDGRQTLQNMDGSEPELRLRRAGGSAANFGAALTAESSFVDTLDPTAPLEDQIMAVDEHVAMLTGFERSAHAGGCGRANGEPADYEAISSNPAILAAATAFLSIPEVRAYFAKGYEKDFTDESGRDMPLADDELIERVRTSAGKTAEFLTAKGWNGQAYVDGVTKEKPHNVEDLKTEHDAYHGHKEGMIYAVIGDETLADDDDFVWNLKASKKIAEALAGQRGAEGYAQAVLTEVASHIATSSRLASRHTPIAVIAKQ